MCHGQAGQVDARGAQLFDVDGGAEQGTAVPPHRHIFKGQPDAFAVCDGDPLDGGAAAQRPGKAVNAYGAALAPQTAFQKADKETAIFLVLLREGCQGPEHDQKYAKKKPHQNACPIPI